jgi:type I restriction enzyme S subunit
MSEWKEYKLGDACTELSDGLHKAPIFVEGGDYIFVNAKNIAKGYIVDNDPTKKSTYEEYLKYSSPLNDTTILYSIDGTIGNIALYRGEKCILGKGACYINPNPQILDRMFLYYSLQSPHFNAYIDQMSTGSTIQHISLKTMRNYVFTCPPLDKQKQIASILTSLDDKIDLLNRENATIEAMAETLFRQWFIEEAKEDWEKGKLGEICEYAKEKADIANIDRNTYITTENMCSNKQGVVPPSSVPENIKVTIYSPDDILLSNIRPYFKKLWLSDRNGGCSNDVLCIRSKSKIFKYFVYYTIRQDEFFDYVMLGSKGSKMPRGDKHHIMNWPIQKPPKQMLELFNEFVLRSIGKMQNNNRQILCLEKQRNTLLPKLMSNTNV